jgi:hypothetical protein
MFNHVFDLCTNLSICFLMYSLAAQGFFLMFLFFMRLKTVAEVDQMYKNID